MCGRGGGQGVAVVQDVLAMRLRMSWERGVCVGGGEGLWGGHKGGEKGGCADLSPQVPQCVLLPFLLQQRLEVHMLWDAGGVRVVGGG